MMKKTSIGLLLLLTNLYSYAFTYDWNTDQRVLFQFEKMLYSNWEGTGFNYASSSVRYLGNFNQISDDSTFRFINNAEAAIGVGYNSADNFKIQENRISATSSANQKFLNDFNFNGTADLKSVFDLKSTYLLGAIGVSFIKGELQIQENPFTIRASFIRGAERTFEFGNYFRVSWKGDLDTNISMTFKVENFYKYGQVFWKESFWNLETMTSFQINRTFTCHLIVRALLDTKQSKKLQAYEKMTIGFTWRL